MRLNVIIIMSCLLVWMSSCNSSKTSQTPQTPKANVESVVETTKENTEKVMTETKAAVVKKPVEKMKEETREVVKKDVKKLENKPDNTSEKAEKKTNQTAADTPLKKVNVKDIKTNKTKVEATQKMQEQKAAIVGKYKWLKRVCCGRMQKVTLPDEGQESFMTFTEDGKVLYSGHAMKNAEDTEYTLEMNARSFPDRPMLKMGKTIPALIHHQGDTIVIDRGYIDLDKTYWLKVE